MGCSTSEDNTNSVTPYKNILKRIFLNSLSTCYEMSVVKPQLELFYYHHVFCYDCIYTTRDGTANLWVMKIKVENDDLLIPKQEQIL